MKKIGVIGSGIAALSFAARLQAKGFEVHVFEKNESYGGKLSKFHLGDYAFDFGPSLFTKPELFNQLFEDCGKNRADYFEYETLNHSCFYSWGLNDAIFKAPAFQEDFIQAAASYFKMPPKDIEYYLKQSQKKYALTEDLFLKSSLQKLKSYFTKKAFKTLLHLPQLNLSKTLHDYNAKVLKEHRLVQLFDRYATYNGSDPFKTSAVMSMIPSLEMTQGCYFPKKGMRTLADSVYQLGVDLGVQFHFNAEVDSLNIQDQKVKGFNANGKDYSFDMVVNNMDINFFKKKVLKEEIQVESKDLSSSALVFYWGVKWKSEDLHLHNILFGPDYKQEFSQIFDEEILPEHPTIYIHNAAQVCKSDAPENGSSLFVLINTPNRSKAYDPNGIAALRSYIIEAINQRYNIDLDTLIEEERILEAHEIESLTASYRGALYGPNSNQWNTAFIRQSNQDKNIKNLYHLGGSVHPGGGIPLCLYAAYITQNLICEQVH